METGTLVYVPLEELKRLRVSVTDRYDRARLFADALRLNTLYMIAKAGSGHLGTSFSAMDIVSWLWTDVLQSPTDQPAQSGDVYFSSKGHDAPGLYSVLLALEKLPFEKIHTLRRFGGLDGHPDVKIPFMVTNTGPLGMGISKARGMAEARRLSGAKGKIFVLTGDGELQEGQIWESLQPTANHRFAEIMVIVDCNKIQSDSLVEQVSDLGDLEAKFKAFGWAVRICDGHDVRALDAAITELQAVNDRPQVIIADTLKGKGVSFMEILNQDGFYKYHAGALPAEEYPKAATELLERLQSELARLGVAPLQVASVPQEPKKAGAPNQELVKAYSDELVKLGQEVKSFVTLDGDLVKSCGLIPFSKAFPERFIECGIAEQDMVSMGSGLALAGVTPIMHSLGCFLSTRPNEQIYNAATEYPARGRANMIYFGSGAGVLPAGPGHSHQEVRAIASVGGVPKLVLLEPANEREMRLAIRWALLENTESTYLRVSSVKIEHVFTLPESHTLVLGRGSFVREGTDILITAYGPTLLNEAVKAADLLKEKGVSAAVLNMPWLNRLDEAWFIETVRAYRAVVTVDDHYIEQGQGQFLAAKLAKAGVQKTIVHIGLTDIPVCGSSKEVLAYHHMDAASIAEAVGRV